MAYIHSLEDNQDEHKDEGVPTDHGHAEEVLLPIHGDQESVFGQTMAGISILIENIKFVAAFCGVVVNPASNAWIVGLASCIPLEVLKVNARACKHTPIIDRVLKPRSSILVRTSVSGSYNRTANFNLLIMPAIVVCENAKRGRNLICVGQSVFDSDNQTKVFFCVDCSHSVRCN